MQQDIKRFPISREKNEIDDQKKSLIPQHKANFEEAISAAGFGKFNICLLCFLIPTSFTQAYENMALSYVLPVAQCDLDITLDQKGLLTAASFGGMIASGLLFGVVCDIFGRRKFIVYGFSLNFLCAVLAALSTNFTTLLIAKFISGFIFNGPFLASTTLITEFHGSKYRNRVQLTRGLTSALGYFLLPIIAWAILPQKIDLLIFGILRIRSWNIYLLVCAAGPLLAAIGFTTLPESPKFLMSNGQNKEALLVFQQVYRWNTGKTDYPIKDLYEEVKDGVDVDGNQGKMRSVKNEIYKFLNNMKPLFKPPYIYRLALACTAAFTLLFCTSIFKLWLPQLLQMTSDYKYYTNETDFNVCNMVNTLSGRNSHLRTTCQVNIDTSVYTNAIIIAGPPLLLFACSGFIIDCVGKIKLISILAIIACICAVCIYFSPNLALLTTLLAIYIPSLDLAAIIVISITLEMFVTHFRTLALSFHLIAARFGSLSANTLFATLIKMGCVTPFAVPAVLSGALPLLMLLYPDTENKALQ